MPAELERGSNNVSFEEVQSNSNPHAKAPIILLADFTSSLSHSDASRARGGTL